MALFFGVIFVVFAASIGTFAVEKIIRVKEAHHDLKHDSASYIRHTSGYIFVLIWMAFVLWCGTILGDWQWTGDAQGALDRGFERIAHILRMVLRNT